VRRARGTADALSTYLVLVRQSGPDFDPSLPLESQSGWDAHARFMDGLVDVGVIVLGGPLVNGRVAHLAEAATADDVRTALAADPWSGSHLVVESIEPWTLRLDGRGR
jgi:hypothetical protein